MFRILRYGLLGLLFALPLAIPQASQAASPSNVVRCRPVIVRPYHAARVIYSPCQPHFFGWYRR
jgi:hypothetical protein